MNPNREQILAISSDGTITAVYSDDLAELLASGQSDIRRASHVEPCPGGWSADLSPVNGPLLGPFVLRGDALAAEIEYLNAHLTEIP